VQIFRWVVAIASFTVVASAPAQTIDRSVIDILNATVRTEHRTAIPGPVSRDIGPTATELAQVVALVGAAQAGDVSRRVPVAVRGGADRGVLPVSAMREPADWTTLLSGLGVVAFIARRKASRISPSWPV